MAQNSNSIERFWKELKRRKVIHVITVYAAVSFVILQLVDIVERPLRLPDWTTAFVIVLLCIGFIIAVFVSWVYDITPSGVKKTKPVSELKHVDHTTHEVSSGWKIATYISAVMIIALIAFNFISRNNLSSDISKLEKSIAVLPFHSFSGDLDQELMSEALTNEIINHLYKIKSFDRVVPFLSAMAYKKTDKKYTIIADELKVNYILYGTYQKLGDSIKITACLIEPKVGDKYIWQNDYRKPYRERISIQSDIALQIASHINAFLTVSEKQSIQKIPTTNQEAYDLVQRAIIGLLTGKITLKQGKDLALKAKDLDPNYANAYAFAGSYSLFEGVYNGNKELPEAILDALPFIENALELDQDNAFAHFTMGCINEWGRWDYIKAEKEYMKSLELEPNNIGAYYYAISEFYVKMNRQGNALTFIKKYKESVNTETIIPAFDPATILIKSSVLSGNSQEASNYITTYFGLHEKKPYAWLGEYYIWLGEYDSAKLSLETAVQNKDYFMLIPRFQVNLALAYYKTKDYQKAHMVINQLIKKSDTTSIGSPQYFTGWYYSGIGEVDSAFYWLEKAYQNRSPEMPWLKVDLAFKNLKNDNRYRDLYKRTGHKAYDDYISNLEK